MWPRPVFTKCEVAWKDGEAHRELGNLADRRADQGSKWPAEGRRGVGGESAE